jgi:hypothetical protein
MEAANMEKGDIVQFKAGLYPDEEGVRYQVVEMNGDRAIIAFMCNLTFPPQSVARTSELEVVQHE